MVSLVSKNKKKFSKYQIVCSLELNVQVGSEGK